MLVWVWVAGWGRTFGSDGVEGAFSFSSLNNLKKNKKKNFVFHSIWTENCNHIMGCDSQRTWKLDISHQNQWPLKEASSPHRINNVLLSTPLYSHPPHFTPSPPRYTPVYPVLLQSTPLYSRPSSFTPARPVVIVLQSIPLYSHPSPFTPVYPVILPSIQFYIHPHLYAPIHPVLLPSSLFYSHPPHFTPIHPVLNQSTLFYSRPDPLPQWHPTHHIEISPPGPRWHSYISACSFADLLKFVLTEVS